MSRFDYLVEKHRRTERRRLGLARPQSVTAAIVASEWRPAPLGRLGRALWLDVERYLEFLAVAREDTVDVSVRGRGLREPLRDPFHA